MKDPKLGKVYSCYEDVYIVISKPFFARDDVLSSRMVMWYDGEIQSIMDYTIGNEEDTNL